MRIFRLILIIFISSIYFSCASNKETIKADIVKLSNEPKDTTELTAENNSEQINNESVLGTQTSISDPGSNNEINEQQEEIVKEQPETPAIIENKFQHEFERKALEFNEKYDNAKNELAKSNIYNEANNWYREFAKKINYTASNWSGVLTTLSTDKGGNYINITIVSNVLSGSNFSIRYMNWGIANNTYSVRKGSKLYYELSKLSELSEGNKIYFSFNFIPDSKKGILEDSITESGAMFSPEFIVKFIKISLDGQVK